MLKVLLVDDEPFIRQGLSILIDWEKEGYQIAGEASNGNDAVAFLEKNKVDLIIADIKMPEMNGIELLKYIKSNQLSEASYVILSGFYEFEYAKTAIRQNCTDYILKPVQKEDLIELLGRIRKQCADEEIKRKGDKEKSKALFDRNMTSLIWGKYDDINMKYVKEHMKLGKELRYIDIEVDFSGLSTPISELEKRNVQRKLYRQCQELLGEYRYHVVFDVTKNEDCHDIGLIYWGYMSKEKGMSEKEYLSKLVAQIEKSVEYPILVYVGNQVEQLENLSESYRTASIARSFKGFRNDKDISYYEEEMKNRTGSVLEKQKLDTLVQAIEMNEKETIEQAVETIYQEIQASNLDYQLINVCINYVLFQLVHIASEQDNNVNQEEILQYISSDAFEREIVRGSSMHFTMFAMKFADYLSQLRKNASRGVLAEIEKEIEEHYGENLSLKTLSEKYFINSAYLGQVFRKKYGQSFKDYINSYRIEKAAQLLLRTDDKVYEVAEKVGYHNLDYFINKFVAEKGCTPTKYRKQILEKA